MINLKYCVNWVFCSSFDPETRYKDIALLRIKRKDPIAAYRVARLCQSPVTGGTRLGTCGLGTTSQTFLQYPDFLRETYLVQTALKLDPVFGYVNCREDQICTYPSYLDRSSTCLGDEGGPLYTFEGSFTVQSPHIK